MKIPFILTPCKLSSNAANYMKIDANRIIRMTNRPGARPYISSMSEHGIHFRKSFRVRKGHVMPSILARRPRAQYVLIEPHNKKAFAGENRQWPLENYRELNILLQANGINTLQVAPDLNLKLDDTIGFEITNTYLEAAFYIREALCTVSAEGGIHHAAAALDVPSVVLWSHYTCPEILGYTNTGESKHVNLRHASGWGCGSFAECQECKESLERISVQEVYESVVQLLKTDTYF